MNGPTAELAERIDEDLGEDRPLALADLRDAAFVVARAEISDAVVDVLNADGRSLREIGRVTGLDPAFLSRLANGKRSATVASLAMVALALGKSLKITIE